MSTEITDEKEKKNETLIVEFRYLPATAANMFFMC